MKKYCSRFLTLVMSMLLMLGCSVTCFAAEPDDVSMPNVPSSEDYFDVDFDICEDYIPSNGIVELAIDKDGTVSLVEPRATGEIFTASGSDYTSDAKWSNKYGVPITGTLHIWISITGSCHVNVKLKLNGSILTTNWINDTLSNGSGDFYSPDTVTAGSTFTVTLSSFKNGTSWSLHGWVD